MKSLFITPLGCLDGIFDGKTIRTLNTCLQEIRKTVALKASRQEINVKLVGAQDTLSSNPSKSVFHLESFYFKTNLKSQ